MTADVIERHLMECEATGLSPATIRGRRELLHRLRADLGPLLTLTTDAIVGWLAPYAGWTLNTYWGHAVAFFRWAVLADELAVDPTRRLKRPRQPKGLPRPASRELFRAIVGDGVEPWVTVVLLAGLAGLRAGDVCRLRREDIDQRVIRVTAGKGNKDAELPTHPDIWAHVKDRPSGLLLTTPRGNPYTAKHLSVRFGAYLEHRGWPHVTAHQFRHLFGTAVYQSTRDLLLTQQLLRHSSVATTQIYAQLADETKTQAVRGLRL
jgi:integrase